MRIWVARPEPGATRTGMRLAQLGHDPLVAPVLVVAGTDAPVPEGRFDAVLLTSGNAVEALARVARSSETPVLAVGAGTAERARRAGLSGIVAAEGDAAALVRLVRDTLRPGAPLLHVAGEDRKAEPAASLGAAGYRLTVWEAYAARPVAVLPRAVADALSGTPPPLAMALHYSRRSASTALALVQAAGFEDAFRALKHGCLSSDVAVPLVEAGIAAHFVPARPNEEALLAGLADPAGAAASHRGAARC